MGLLGQLKQFVSGDWKGPDSAVADKKRYTRIAIAGVCVIVSLAAVTILSSQDSKRHMQKMAYATLVDEQKVISQNIAIDAIAAVSRDMTVFGQLASSQSRYN